jgi:hypothetical protein
VIAEALPNVKAELLRCPLSALERVIILRNKDDYRYLAESNGIETLMHVGSSVRRIDEISTDVSGAKTKATDDFFSCSLSHPETLRIGESAKSDTAATAKKIHIIESGIASESVSSVADIGSYPVDSAPKEIDSVSELSNTLISNESPLVDGLSIANNPVETDSAQNSGPEENIKSDETANASASKTIELTRRIQLEVGLFNDDEAGAAFGLWLPPKIGSKDFKKWLGESADDTSIRDFYARHRRLHILLTDLKRKIIRAKNSPSKDDVLSLRLICEEVVFHLSKLAVSSLKIEEQSKNERLRIQKEDWIEQNQAVTQPRETTISDASKSRSNLVEDTFALLSGDFKLYVVDGEDSCGGETQSMADTTRLRLRMLVQRLNSVLLATF